MDRSVHPLGASGEGGAAEASEYVGYLVRGTRQGFHMGFRYWDQACRGSVAMRSAEENPQVIDEYLARELERGRVLGPLALEVSQAVHINRFGLYPRAISWGNGGLLWTCPTQRVVA